MKETFNCVILSREDFESRGFDTKGISDTDMAHIADKIGEGLMEHYWDLIDFYAEHHSMPPTPRVALIECIKDVVAAHDGEIELHSEGNYPVLNEEDIVIDENYITRFVGEMNEESTSYALADIDELEFIKDLLVESGYLAPDFKPVTILDKGNDAEELHTFNTLGETLTWFNDNFSAATGSFFETLADCLAFVANSSYLSLVDKDCEFFKLKTNLKERVSKHVGEEINLGENESGEDVMITADGVYREYRTMGQRLEKWDDMGEDDTYFWISILEDVENAPTEEEDETKEYEVTLYYHQAVKVKVKAASAEDAVQQAYAADFEDPTICEQLGWEEDGTPDVEEI